MRELALTKLKEHRLSPTILRQSILIRSDLLPSSVHTHTDILTPVSVGLGLVADLFVASITGPYKVIRIPAGRIMA